MATKPETDRRLPDSLRTRCRAMAEMLGCSTSIVLNWHYSGKMKYYVRRYLEAEAEGIKPGPKPKRKP